MPSFVAPGVTRSMWQSWQDDQRTAQADRWEAQWHTITDLEPRACGGEGQEGIDTHARAGEVSRRIVPTFELTAEEEIELDDVSDFLRSGR